ncbi:hypothetical protein [Micromonospora sp. LOL_021]|uniref:hypothetical protein n=1 Tax=Micromonospora sp. LOL_021 TaxID=3345417 RepID=UPI003A85C007
MTETLHIKTMPVQSVPPEPAAGPAVGPSPAGSRAEAPNGSIAIEKYGLTLPGAGWPLRLLLEFEESEFQQLNAERLGRLIAI